ncbi:GntR family transcriptional regulator [Fictibacillus enclensis]|uniref:GntR family transcriptional regulator n=1 Tax=Fictibacillus enclensis TaxID=1017270 RepID=UPI0024C02F54|nr:GntR family transcriptional regulator [Fictibacillus enclensis]WHY71771.1 GntR family transcriptional regulator [Fictibacillus enclensis]
MVMQLEKQSVVSQIREYIKGEILDQRLKPGEKVTINQIAGELSCSIVPVREALSSLYAEGLVDFTPYRGYIVTPLLDQKAFKQLYETRKILELNAMELAVEHITEDAILQLESILEESQITIPDLPVYTQFRPFIDADEKFHIYLFEIAGNPYLLQAWKGLNIHLHNSRLYHPKGQVDVKEGTEEHRQIIAALKNRDLEQVLQAMEKHLEGSYSRLAL